MTVCGKNRPQVTDAMVTSALLDLKRAVDNVQSHMALIGGQALQSYGVPGTTKDADFLVPLASLRTVANELADAFDYTPLDYDDETGDYASVDRPVVLLMQDPVLFDVGQEREMIALCSPLELLVEILAAQHPIEEEMVDRAAMRLHHSVHVMVAPLGGILLVKVKANRNKDISAIEQAAEHLPAEQMNAAMDWAGKRDAATTEDLRAIVQNVRTRRRPRRRT